MIVAELTHDQETVRFQWNDCGVGLVNVKQFDLNRDAEAYSEVYEAMEHARKIWVRLVELGFKRTRLEEIDPVTGFLSAVPNLFKEQT